jgi:hypothetical protein
MFKTPPLEECTISTVKFFLLVISHYCVTLVHGSSVLLRKGTGNREHFDKLRASRGIGNRQSTTPSRNMFLSPVKW